MCRRPAAGTPRGLLLSRGERVAGFLDRCVMLSGARGEFLRVPARVFEFLAQAGDDRLLLLRPRLHPLIRRPVSL